MLSTTISNFLNQSIQESMMKRIIWCLVTCLSLTCVESNKDEHALIKHLLRNHDINVRPVANHTQTLTVDVNLAIVQIIDLDERSEVLSANYLLQLHWTDCFLHWDPDSYSGLQDIRINPGRIWKPDITLDNNVCTECDDIQNLHPAVIHYDGNVSWTSRVTYKTSCTVHMKYFPWDQQACYLLFSSWGYDIKSMDIIASGVRESLDFFHGDAQWIIEHIFTTREILARPYPFPLITYTFHLKRKPNYVLVNLFAPSLCVTFCAFLVFLLPTESGEKVSLTVTLLLSLIVFLLLVADYMPPHSDVMPLISQYFVAVIVLLVLSTCTTVFVMYIHFQGRFRIRLPIMARKIILEWLATVVFMRGYIKNFDSRAHKYKSDKHKPTNVVDVATKHQTTAGEAATIVTHNEEAVESFHHASADRLVDNIPNIVLDKRPDSLPDSLPESLPDRLPDRLLDEKPDLKTPNKMVYKSDKMPDKTVGKASAKNPDKMPDKKPDNGPDKLPGIETVEEKDTATSSSISLSHAIYPPDFDYLEWVLGSMVLDRVFMVIFILVTLFLTVIIMLSRQDHDDFFANLTKFRVGRLIQ